MEQNPHIEKDDDDKIVPFPPLKALAGGKDDGGPWLAALEAKSVFLARPKREDKLIELTVYIKMRSTENERGTHLMIQMPKEEIFVWVDTVRFSNEYELIDVLYVGTDPH